jgi:hypothetical protein
MIQLRSWLLICAAVLMVSCLPEKKSGGGQRPAAADANCGSRTTSNCATNTNCQVSGTQCVGTLTYCNGYQTETSCPGSSCQWSMSSNTCSPIVPFTPSSTDATAGGNCSSYYQASACPSPTCVWNGVSCVANTSTTNPTTNPNPTNNPDPGPGQPLPIVNQVCDSIGEGVVAQTRCWLTNGCRYYYCALGFCDNSSGVRGCHAQGIP